MKVGTENRAKLKWALGLGAVALVLVVYQLIDLSGSPAAANTSSQPASTVEPVNKPKVRRTSGASKANHAFTARLDPTLDLNLLRESEDVKYAGSGRNIFIAHEDVVIPVPKGSGVTGKQAPITPPPPPPPPPFPLKFFGFASKPGQPKRIFLSKGEDVFIAGEGDIVDRRYKIVHIEAQSVLVEDVINNNRQTIPLTQG